MTNFLRIAISLVLVALFSHTSIAQPTTAQQDTRTWEQMMQDPSTNFFEIQDKFKSYWQGRPIEKGKGYKAFKRWEWFMEPRVGPDGSWPQPDAVQRAMNDQPEMFMENTMMVGNWSYIGNTSVPASGGGAGRINS